MSDLRNFGYSRLQQLFATLYIYLCYIQQMGEVQHILMVDDDADDQFLFVEALKQIQQSCTCEIANNGLEALEKLDM